MIRPSYHQRCINSERIWAPIGIISHIITIGLGAVLFRCYSPNEKRPNVTRDELTQLGSTYEKSRQGLDHILKSQEHPSVKRQQIRKLCEGGALHQISGTSLRPDLVSKVRSPLCKKAEGILDRETPKPLLSGNKLFGTFALGFSLLSFAGMQTAANKKRASFLAISGAVFVVFSAALAIFSLSVEASSEQMTNSPLPALPFDPSDLKVIDK